MAKFGKQELEADCIIRTWSGLDVDLRFPTVEMILVDDIAAALANVHRFGGHTRRPYTVAEHCLGGLEYSLPQYRLEFLMHDAPEAYLGDVTGPLKRMCGMDFYRELEGRWAALIAARFGLATELPREVKEIDQRMLVTEQRDLCGRMPLSTDKFPPFRMHIGQVAPDAEMLRREFLDAFEFLVKKTPGARR
jgi:hypothetical protein